MNELYFIKTILLFSYTVESRFSYVSIAGHVESCNAHKYKTALLLLDIKIHCTNRTIVFTVISATFRLICSSQKMTDVRLLLLEKQYLKLFVCKI